MTAIIGQPRSFLKKFLFRVEIPGIAWVGFQKCSEPKLSTAVVYQWEGSGFAETWNAAFGAPGRMKAMDITLERGASKDLDLWHWYREVNDAARNSGLVGNEYKRLVNLVSVDRDGSVIRRTELTNAWPSEYSAGDRDNGTDGNAIESLVLTYDYFEFDDDRTA